MRVLASRLPAFFGRPFVPPAAHTVHANANANSANNPPLDETTAAILRSRLDLEELEHLHQAITSNLKHQAAACTIQAMIANPASFDGPWTFLKVQPTLSGRGGVELRFFGKSNQRSGMGGVGPWTLKKANTVKTGGWVHSDAPITITRFAWRHTAHRSERGSSYSYNHVDPVECCHVPFQSLRASVL